MTSAEVLGVAWDETGEAVDVEGENEEELLDSKEEPDELEKEKLELTLEEDEDFEEFEYNCDDDKAALESLCGSSVRSRIGLLSMLLSSVVCSLVGKLRNFLTSREARLR